VCRHFDTHAINRRRSPNLSFHKTNLRQEFITNVPGYENVNEKSFAVFVCVAISITAFPVLARILNETNMLGTVVGATAIGAAALDDVVAWSLLGAKEGERSCAFEVYHALLTPSHTRIAALSIALIHAGEGGNMMTAVYIFLSVAAYAAVMLGVVRPVWCVVDWSDIR
jgi:hypothetical protein